MKIRNNHQMKFIVSRTSQYLEEKPCDEAIQETVIYTDERNVKDPFELPRMAFGYGEKWYKDPNFFNHRVEDGHIKRDYKRLAWTIEINSLEELLKFCDKYGNIVIQSTDCLGNIKYEIEIYDDWRE